MSGYKETLIVPDVHGRDFWRKPVDDFLKGNKGNVIFLGDYVDPYSEEFPDGVDCGEIAFETLEDIIELKKGNEDRVTLLLGNHDCGYIYGRDVCDCRTDRKRFYKIKSLFISNIGEFKMAEEMYIEGERYIFSHSAITRKYIEYIFGEVESENLVKTLNEKFSENDIGLINTLGWVDSYRCQWSNIAPSFLWTDVRYVIDRISDGKCTDLFDGFNIFGHTRLVKGKGPIAKDNFAMIDDMHCYVISDKDKVEKYTC